MDLFPYFTSLPPEIRQQVWRCAIDENKASTLYIRPDWSQPPPNEINPFNEEDCLNEEDLTNAENASNTENQSDEFNDPNEEDGPDEVNGSDEGD